MKSRLQTVTVNSIFTNTTLHFYVDCNVEVLKGATVSHGGKSTILSKWVDIKPKWRRSGQCIPRRVAQLALNFYNAIRRRDGERTPDCFPYRFSPSTHAFQRLAEANI